MKTPKKMIKVFFVVLFMPLVLVGCAKVDPAAQIVSDQIAEMKESGSYSLQDIENIIKDSELND